MAAELITPAFIWISLLTGIFLGFITIATGKPIYKIIDLIGLLVILGGFWAFMPNPNESATTVQAANQISDIMLYFVNVIVPYLIGDAISAAGYFLITGKKN